MKNINFYKSCQLGLAAFLGMFLMGFYSTLFAQEAKPEFNPNGKPIIQIHANWHTSIEGEEHSNAFAVTRAYFGYKYNMHENFRAVVKLDIGSPEDASEFLLRKRFGYFKNAYAEYHKNGFSMQFGIVDMIAFKEQEKFWGYRYIYKSLQDEQRITSSADIALTAAYKISDKVKVDAQMMNGEGYKDLQRDATYRIGAGVTTNPWDWIVLRLYYDASAKSATQSTLSAFAGLKYKKLASLGLEYMYRANDKYQSDHNRVGYSVYARVFIGKKFEVFGRYDYMMSNKLNNETNPWNLSDDGSAIITGVQYAPIKNIRISANYQDWVPYASNMSTESYFYISMLYVI